MYYNKYIKYKAKYLNLLDLSGGGDDKIIDRNFFSVKHEIFLDNINYKKVEIIDDKKIRLYQKVLYMYFHSDKFTAVKSYEPNIQDKDDIRYIILNMLFSYINIGLNKIKIDNVVALQKFLSENPNLFYTRGDIQIIRSTEYNTLKVKLRELNMSIDNIDTKNQTNEYEEARIAEEAIRKAAEEAARKAPEEAARIAAEARIADDTARKEAVNKSKIDAEKAREARKAEEAIRKAAKVKKAAARKAATEEAIRKEAEAARIAEEAEAATTQETVRQDKHNKRLMNMPISFDMVDDLNYEKQIKMLKNKKQPVVRQINNKQEAVNKAIIEANNSYNIFNELVKNFDQNAADVLTSADDASSALVKTENYIKAIQALKRAVLNNKLNVTVDTIVATVTTALNNVILSVALIENLIDNTVTGTDTVLILAKKFCIRENIKAVTEAFANVSNVISLKILVRVAEQLFFLIRNFVDNIINIPLEVSEVSISVPKRVATFSTLNSALSRASQFAQRIAINNVVNTVAKSAAKSAAKYAVNTVNKVEPNIIKGMARHYADIQADNIRMCIMYAGDIKKVLDILKEAVQDVKDTTSSAVDTVEYLKKSAEIVSYIGIVLDVEQKTQTIESTIAETDGAIKVVIDIINKFDKDRDVRLINQKRNALITFNEAVIKIKELRKYISDGKDKTRVIQDFVNDMIYQYREDVTISILETSTNEKTKSFINAIKQIDNFFTRAINENSKYSEIITYLNST